jgi:hypothetical protein
MSSDEIGAAFDLSGRHVRRYAESGLLPTVEPGRHDVSWFANLRVGEEVARKLGLEDVDGTHLVALGRDRSWTKGDEALFVAMCERNGISRDTAMRAQGYARAVRK